MTMSAVTLKTAVGSISPPQPRIFTFEEYCCYEDGTDDRYELVEGYLQLMAPPAGLHIIICEFLVYIFNKLFAHTQTQLRAGKEVGVKINNNTCRIVDVCVNREEHWLHIAQVGEQGIFQQNQTPLLVIEVTSTNETEDYKKKHKEYAAIQIPEYWIINRNREHIRVCNSAYPGGPYQDEEFLKGEQILSKVLPQLRLTVDEVLNPLSVRRLMEIDQAQQVAERNVLEAEKATVTAERDVLEAEKATVTAERDVLEAEKATVTAERDVLEAKNAKVTAERDVLKMELERLKALMKLD